MSFRESKSCVEVRLFTVNTSHGPIHWSKQSKVTARTCPRMQKAGHGHVLLSQNGAETCLFSENLHVVACRS